MPEPPKTFYDDQSHQWYRKMKGGGWVHRLDGPAVINFRIGIIAWWFQNQCSALVYNQWGGKDNIHYLAKGSHLHAPASED